MKIISNTLKQLNDLYPTLSYEKKTFENYSAIDFISQDKNDYYFSIEYTNKILLSISATLINIEHNYFWYQPYDEFDIDKEEEILEEALVEDLKVLLFNDTRIVYKSGLLFNSLKLEYNNNEKWHYFYGLSYNRFGFKGPKLNKRVNVFQSKAFVP